MDEYMILYRETNVSTSVVRSLMAYSNIEQGLTKKTFDTLDAAIEFAKSLKFDVVIYKGIAVSTIKYDILINEEESSKST